MPKKPKEEAKEIIEPERLKANVASDCCGAQVRDYDPEIGFGTCTNCNETCCDEDMRTVNYNDDMPPLDMEEDLD